MEFDRHNYRPLLRGNPAKYQPAHQRRLSGPCTHPPTHPLYLCFDSFLQIRGGQADSGANRLGEKTVQSQQIVSSGNTTGRDVLCLLDAVRLHVPYSSVSHDLIARLDANAHIGYAMSHRLQIDLLRAHLRLSVSDLQNAQIQRRHNLVPPDLRISLISRQEHLQIVA